METVTFPNHTKGDWWSDAAITITPKLGTDPIDLLTCTAILMQVKLDKTSKKSFLEFSLANGKITVPQTDKIIIAGQVVDIPANFYFSDIEVVTADGKPVTLFSIEWTIDQDTSRKEV